MKTDAATKSAFTAAGKTIECPHCGGTSFTAKNVLLNSRGLTFFNLDWANKAATALTCTNCHRMEWYAVPPNRSEPGS